LKKDLLSLTVSSEIELSLSRPAWHWMGMSGQFHIAVTSSVDNKPRCQLRRRLDGPRTCLDTVAKRKTAVHIKNRTLVF